MCEKEVGVRQASLITEDLKYNEETQPGPMTSGRAFVLCELVIYRFRDIRYEPENPEHAILTELAEEIAELHKSWRGK